MTKNKAYTKKIYMGPRKFRAVSRALLTYSQEDAGLNLSYRDFATGNAVYGYKGEVIILNQSDGESKLEIISRKKTVTRLLKQLSSISKVNLLEEVA